MSTEQRRWFFARIAWCGDVMFQADAIDGETIKVFRLSAVLRNKDTGEFVYAKQGLYGIVHETAAVTIRRDDVQMVGLPMKHEAEKCDRLWSAVVTAPASALNRLNGGRGK